MGRTLVFKLGDGALDGELVANVELVDILGHLALVIALDEEGELFGVVRRGDGGVGANDGLAVVEEGVGSGDDGVRSGIILRG